jgi:Fungal specific transcription factor domain
VKDTQIFKVPGSHFEYLPLFLQKCHRSKCIIWSCYSAALANLARDRQDGQLMYFSRKFYVNALKHVNMALRSNEETVRNSTIVAVLVMGLFEAIIFEDKSLDSWVAHTNGTLSLLKYRGERLLHTSFGKRIFVQVANHIRANCIQQGTLLPPALTELHKKMAPFLDEDEFPMIPFWPVLPHKLVYMVKHIGSYHPMEIIQFGVKQDAQHTRVVEKTERLMRRYGLSFHRLPTDSFKEIAHERSTIAVVRLLNTAHLMRIIRCERMGQMVDFIRNSQSDRTKTAREAWDNFHDTLQKVVRASADGILGNIPQYIYPDASHPGGVLRTTSVSPLLWPLSAFARCRLITSKQRESAKNALKEIGQRAKLPIATKIADNFQLFKVESLQYDRLHLLLLA